MRRLSLIAVSALLTALLAVSVTGCGGAEQRKDRHMRVGEALYQEGAYAKAGIEFGAVLKIDPDDVPARFMLGRSLEAAGDAQGAGREYLAALEIEPGHVPALERLSRLLLAARATAQAETLAQQLLAREPDNAVGLAVMAGVNASRGQVEAALALAERAAGRDSPDPDVTGLLVGIYLAAGEEDRAVAMLEHSLGGHPQAEALGVLLAGLYDRRGEFQRAEALLQQLLEQADEGLQPRLRLALARLYESRGKQARAESLYRRVIAGQDAGELGEQARVRLARLLLARGELETGRALLAEVLASDQGNVAALALRGRLRLLEGNGEGAVADLERVLVASPRSVETLELLARAHRLQGDIDAARQRLAQIVELAPQDHESRLDYARVLAQAGEREQALAQLDAALEGDPQGLAALELKARIQLAEADYAAAARTAAAIERAAPDRALGPYYAALASLGMGEVEVGIEQLGTALDREPGAVEPLTALVNAYLEQDRPEQAAARLEKTLAELPDHAVARNLLGELRLRRGDHAGAAEAFVEVTRQRPQWWPPYRSLARTELARGDRDAAIRALRAGVANAEDAEPLVIDLALLYEREGEIDLAIQTYETHLAERPGAQTPANNLAMLLVEHRDDAQARALELIEVLETEGNAAFLDTVGRVRLEAGQVEAAVESLEQALALAPEAAEIRYHLARAQAAAGDEDSARRELEQALAGESGGAWVQEARELLARLGPGP